ncbi:Sensory transduction protein LytR [compost metagenome]
MEKRITAVIIDDETQSRFVLQTLITQNFPKIELIGEAANVDEAYQLVLKMKPQLVFLDIQMPRSDGFTLLKQFEKVPFEVIFVTSFDQYAIRAIKFSALDYLLKPVEVSDLEKAILKAQESIVLKRNNQPHIINLLKNMEDQENQSISVHTADSVRMIEENAIVSIMSDGNYCTIRTDSNDRFITTRRLIDFEEYFDEVDSAFIRISRRHIINTKKILKYSKGDPCIIEMSNEEVFEVSRRRKTEVLSRLKHYWK